MSVPVGSGTQGNPLFKLPFDIQNGNDGAALRRM
jgi:hypothetical protein